jgi:hypothetical protein
MYQPLVYQLLQYYECDCCPRAAECLEMNETIDSITKSNFPGTCAIPGRFNLSVTVQCFSLTTNQRTTHFSLAFQRNERARVVESASPALSVRRDVRVRSFRPEGFHPIPAGGALPASVHAEP